ncbi:MAG: NfeD family protein [Actinobacteria bacterium]|nr:NfeD family protein [Actinomycetota bacterium]
MQGWYFWIIAAIGLFIAEILTPSFFLACLGIAALVSAIVSFLGMGAAIQFIAFCIASIITLIGIRPFFLKYLRNHEQRYKTNAEGLVGRTAIVEETINSVLGEGRVKVGGESWRGFSINNTIISAGTVVKIKQVDGTKLFVEPFIK